MPPPNPAGEQGEGAAVAAEFSAADAALTGFRVVWERPRALAFWAPVQFVLTAAASVVVAQSVAPLMNQVLAQLSAPQPDLAAAVELYRRLFVSMGPLLALSLVAQAIVAAAVNRAVLRPRDDRFGYLRLSGDELRQLGLFALILAAECGAVIAASLVIAVLDPAGAAFAVLALAPALVFGFVFLGVRISLASAATFDQGRLDLASSWRLTRGRFWPLLGTYLVALALWFVVAVLTIAIADAVAGIVAMSLGDAAAASQGGAKALAELVSPAGVVSLVISAAGQALAWPITPAPPAAIYRILAGPGRASRVFD